MLEAFGDAQGIAVDTHCKRLSNRIGLSKEIEPSKIEQDLLKKIPKTYWAKINHLFIDHGRKVCKAPKPLCENCVIKNKCEYYKKQNKVKSK
jgi:endonuclease-3